MVFSYSYVFVGHVLPIAADVTLAQQNFIIDIPSEDGRIRGIMDITHSAITITIRRTELIHDLPTVKDRLQRWALVATAAYGFANGLGLDVEITQEIGESHPPFLFVKTNADAPRAANPDEAMARYWNLTAQPSSRPMRLALIHYMRALREPEEAMMFCYRALEALCHDPIFYISKKNMKKNWQALQKALNIDKAYLDPLTERATDHRHGGQMIPRREEYTAALKTAHRVIERYASYLNTGNLAPETFPQLTTSEFHSNTSVTNATSRISMSSTSRTHFVESHDLSGKHTH